MSPKPLEFDGRARMWPNDFAPWEVQLPVCASHGIAWKIELPARHEGRVYLLELTRKDRSDGAWNFYETSRKRLAPAY